jgi:hypothetical protein
MTVSGKIAQKRVKDHFDTQMALNIQGISRKIYQTVMVKKF